jgi:hypothetical protein
MLARNVDFKKLKNIFVLMAQVQIRIALQIMIDQD